MASQQPGNELEALELVKRSLLHKNYVISHLQQEVETWKQKYCTKEEEVKFLTTQLNEQQSFSNASDDVKGFGTCYVENPSDYNVQVKEEAYEDEDWPVAEAESALGRLGNKRGGTLCSDALRGTPGSTNVAVKGSTSSQQTLQRTPGSTNVAVKGSPSSQQTLQREDQTPHGRAITELSENVEYLETTEDPPARRAPQMCFASTDLRALKDPGEDRPLQQTCPKCGSASVNQSDLDSHICTQTENELLSCPSEGCDYRTRRFWCLEQHSRTHTGEKPFACAMEGCGYRCAQSSNLKRHERTHTLEKPFACPVEGCGHRSAQSSDMKVHVRTHTGKKPFACTVEGCGYRSAQASQVKVHMRTHTGEKPFACTVEGCWYRSNRLSNLKDHARTHTGEKPFACPVEGCGYRSSKSSNLKEHVRTHTGKKPFACTVDGCGYRSALSSSMRMHVKTHTDGHSSHTV